MNVWIVTLIITIAIIGVFAFGIVNVNADEEIASCETCGGECSATNNCGLETCGAVNGGSCDCGG